MSEWKQGAAKRRDSRRTRTADAPSNGKKRSKRHVEKPFVVEHKAILYWYESRFKRISDAEQYADKCRRSGWKVRTNYDSQI